MAEDRRTEVPADERNVLEEEPASEEPTEDADPTSAATRRVTAPGSGSGRSGGAEREPGTRS